MPITKISAQAQVLGTVRKSAVWPTLSDFSQFPKLINSIDKVEILAKTATEGRSEWFVTIDGAPFTWIQRDVYDVEKKEIRFYSIAGDFETISGVWKIEDTRNSGLTLSLTMEYELGIPVIEEALGDIFCKKMQDGINLMLAPLPKEFAQYAINERTLPRTNVGVYNTLAVNGKDHRVFVVNFSEQGIMFDRDSAPVEYPIGDVSLALGDLQLKAKSFLEGNARTGRLVFGRKLDTKELETTIDYMKKSAKRDCTRLNVKREAIFYLSNLSMNVFIHDISNSGMKISYEAISPDFGQPFKFCEKLITPTNIHHSKEKRQLRFSFGRELSHVEFTDLCSQMFGGEGLREPQTPYAVVYENARDAVLVG